MKVKTIFTRKLQGNSYLAHHLKKMRIEAVKQIKIAEKELQRPLTKTEWLQINGSVMRQLG